MRFRGRTLRLDLNEISGSLGDLATFLPLAVGLIAVNGVNATSIFLSAGLLYIAAGLYYGVPVPVQPLKATQHRLKPPLLRHQSGSSVETSTRMKPWQSLDVLKHNV